VLRRAILKCGPFHAKITALNIELGAGLVLFGAGVGLVLFGVFLILTREWSAELHERWNQKFCWTRWATGPRAMRASRIANVLVGIGLIVLGIGSVLVGTGLIVPVAFPTTSSIIA
jgi:hypothetical protein